MSAILYVPRATTSQILTHCMLFLSNLSYSCAYIFAKYPLQFIHPYHYTSIRSLISTTVMILFWFYKDFNFSFEYRKDLKPRHTWKNWFLAKIPNWQDAKLLILSGLFLIPLNQNMFAAGLSYADAVVGAAIQPSGVVFTAIISVLLGNEKLSLQKVIGIVFAVLGATFMVLSTSSTDNSIFSVTKNTLIGSCFFIGNCVTYSIAMNVSRVLQDRNISSTTVAVWSSLFGTIASCLISLVYYDATDFSKTDVYCFLGVFYHASFGGAVPYMVNVFAVSALSPVIMSSYITTIPIFSMLLALANGKKYPLYSIFSILMIVIGVSFVGFSNSKKHEKKEDDEEEALLLNTTKKRKRETV